jgi:hypothetical protein
MAVVALLPLTLAVTLLLTRPPYFRAELTDEALVVENPPLTIPYAEMEGIAGKGRPANPYAKGRPAYPIQIFYSRGTIWIPARLNVPSDEVFRFLFRRFPERAARPANRELKDFYQSKVAEYGSARVAVYNARTTKGPGPSRRRARKVFLALLLCGGIWIVYGVMTHGREACIGLGVALAFLSIIACLITFATTGPAARIKNRQHSSLIVCPDGLALVQGDLTGELSWEEVRDVKLKSWPPLILIMVSGALIQIVDLYDSPLSQIFEKIDYYRGGEPEDFDQETVWKLAEEKQRGAEEDQTGIREA